MQETMSGGKSKTRGLWKRRRALGYLAVVLLAALAGLAFSLYFDPYAKLYRLSVALQPWHLDETVFVFFCLALASTWVAFRRSREMEEENQVRRVAEGRLQVAYNDLRSAYESLKLAQDKAIASEKLAAVGLLASGVSHEILNPLNVITMRLELLVNDPATPKETARHLRTLQEQAGRITRITGDLLHFARQKPPERRSMDLNETVRRTLGLLEHEMRLDEISVELELDEALPPVTASQDQFQQVVFNLLVNARDALSGGGRIVLSTSSFGQNGSSYAELRVKDDGPGIPARHMDRLFDPFFTTKPEGRGTGLGLSICRGIVDAHGGTIQAESAVGRGATFVVRLPLNGAEEAVLAQP